MLIRIGNEINHIFEFRLFQVFLHVDKVYQLIPRHTELPRSRLGRPPGANIRVYITLGHVA